MQEHPWVFCEDLLFIFGVRDAFGFDACCLFPQCVKATIPLIGAIHSSREMEAMGRGSSQCLVAGPLTVARTHKEVVQAAPICRVLGSSSDTEASVGSS